MVTVTFGQNPDPLFFSRQYDFELFRVKFIEKLSNGLIDIHLIVPPIFEFWDEKIQNPFVWKNLKFHRENVVQSFYTGRTCRST